MDANPLMSKREAIELARNSSKFLHSLIVSAIMGKLAERLGEARLEWELAGLLHDLDIDQVRNDMSKHGVVAAEKLEGRLPEHCLYAIRSHDFRTGIKPTSELDKALIAVDSVAVIVERIGKQPEELDVDILKAELERVSVERPWHRSNVIKSRELGLKVDEFLSLCLDAISEAKRISDNY
jgi:putative nucleotidyltransferase with HDIG domain